MSTNNFVYPHPINVFVIKQIGVTVDQFCEMYGYAQPTVASWVTRNRKVGSLPVDFIYSLSLAAGIDMDKVYDNLLLLESEYEIHLSEKKRVKKEI